MTGGPPTNVPSYTVFGGNPSSLPTCYINSIPCYNLPVLNGGIPTSIATYFVTGGLPSSVPRCYIIST